MCGDEGCVDEVCVCIASSRVENAKKLEMKRKKEKKRRRCKLLLFYVNNQLSNLSMFTIIYCWPQVAL